MIYIISKDIGFAVYESVLTDTMVL